MGVSSSRSAQKLCKSFRDAGYVETLAGGLVRMIALLVASTVTCHNSYLPLLSMFTVGGTNGQAVPNTVTCPGGRFSDVIF